MSLYKKPSSFHLDGSLPVTSDFMNRPCGKSDMESKGVIGIAQNVSQRINLPSSCHVGSIPTLYYQYI